MLDIGWTALLAQWIVVMIVESTLKRICATWGIYIRIQARVEVSETLRIDIVNDQSIFLDEEELGLLREGIVSTWKDKPESEAYKILVTQIQFNLCDYQKEGLYWVGRNLAEKILGLPASEPEFVFDKTQNKYHIRIPGVED